MTVFSCLCRTEQLYDRQDYLKDQAMLQESASPKSRSDHVTIDAINNIVMTSQRRRRSCWQLPQHDKLLFLTST
jgi:hypothetical protein